MLIFTLFGWFYPARIIRAVVLSLREKEFVEAARMVGSSDWRIIRSHILPHLVAPIIVYSTLSVAGFILGEAGLSYLGVGIKLPDGELGEPAPAGVRVLHDAAVADGLAGHGRPDHDARRSTCSATASATRSTRAATASHRQPFQVGIACREALLGLDLILRSTT